jgi:hypothetical protein
MEVVMGTLIYNVVVIALVLVGIVAIYKWIRKRSIIKKIKDTLVTVGTSLRDGKVTKAEAAAIIEDAKKIIDGS